MPEVTRLLADIADVGRDAVRGGWSRPVLSTAELDLRAWFVGEAERRGLDVETDRNGILWAWWNPAGLPLRDAVVTGSHLDSVPGGGEFDGPLGVASALAAVDLLQQRGSSLARPLAVAVFPEEEGSRFGVACLGSRLLTGAIDPDRARGLRDPEGVTLAEAAAAQGFDPSSFGRDDEALARIGCFLELHVEQGRGLVDLGQPVAIGSSILGHGRWRLTFAGQGNHAGTTLMDDRRDPMVAAARAVVAVRDAARARPDARATVGRLRPVPGGTNVIASRVELWLDARHPDDAVTTALVAEIEQLARQIAAEEGCTASLVEESFSVTTVFDEGLRGRIEAVLPNAPLLGTGAGHDAGVLGTVVPTAMLFVRSPDGISHSPEESVEDADAEAGAVALADALESLLT
ncbi:N-carbamoyl-L-amino-acid hydrolase [Motilibacter rhizosphaerae]|uniref:N-carbamoyl-L-amino-acid hydrolase n=1 Tax=Motilibacter rhizosphaerae TaxID=598652 RepID=A0A4Q7N7Q2_9ACTN|nr:allantoate amidohydrolase [Motilibacter rhizosphaerae]RZS77569.1 N-carbamoyl-L-amino-acid hydrolase [Motilibacter rhizosphaerae]